jgi:hypothetical protein
MEEAASQKISHSVSGNTGDASTESGDSTSCLAMLAGDYTNSSDNVMIAFVPIIDEGALESEMSLSSAASKKDDKVIQRHIEL